MAYSSLASIYALILAKTYKYTPLKDQVIEDPYQTGDIDMVALWCILSAGWFVVVPFLSWSSTLRRLRSQRHIFTYWTLLIAVGGTCAGITLRGGQPFEIYWASAAAICTSKPDRNQNPAELYLSSWLAWSSNNCTSLCGSLQPGLSLRTGTQMVPIIQTELPNTTLPIINGRAFLGSLTGYASPIAFIQWLYACWSGRRTPSEARDLICTKLCGRKSSYPRTKSVLAVSLAISVYTFACASLTICPFLFVFNIIFNEMNMLYLPQDEPITAVGQWSQCVIAFILIIAAVINKYHDSWSYRVKNIWNIAIATLSIHGKQQSPDLKDLERNEDWKISSLQLTSGRLAKEKPLVSCEPILHNDTVSEQLTDPLREAWYHVCREWREFRRWIRNPVEVSRSNTTLRNVMAARADRQDRFQNLRSNQTGNSSPVFPAVSWMDSTYTLGRQRSRSL
ncbi:hypothetical protein MMC07_009883 [Pseudocyphellaria aurata]|nr:hypothetical protein [Pseudocyphellaria aurata]